MTNGAKFPPHYYYKKCYGDDHPVKDFLPGPLKKLVFPAKSAAS